MPLASTIAGRGKALPCTPSQEGAAKPRPYLMKEIVVSGWRIGNGSTLRYPWASGCGYRVLGSAAAFGRLCMPRILPGPPFQFMPNPWSFGSVIRTLHSTQHSVLTFTLLHLSLPSPLANHTLAHQFPPSVIRTPYSTRAARGAAPTPRGRSPRYSSRAPPALHNLSLTLISK